MHDDTAKMTDEPVLLYTTWPSIGEAGEAGRKLVEAGLAACVNILPQMHSIYRWQGKIDEADEAVMIVKTRRSLAERAIEMVKANHSYETPAALVLPVLGGSQPYIEWLLAETETS
jgi:periplasmic divalent cation tolerance protein